MKIVDASVGFKWLVPEQDSDKAFSLQAEELHAPDFFPVEVTNAIHVSALRGRVVDAQLLLDDLIPRMPILHSSADLLTRSLEIATQFRRSIYDSLYVALAEREQCQLVTADQKLLNSLRGHFTFIVDLASLP
ncbi:MAG: type II toxin-antitoxin system VapC family toxin [Planctomycetes bacterium]|nr:type II toxin-antitoxin system VapC family toxin [Planctomycetota bacterium]